MTVIEDIEHIFEYSQYFRNKLNANASIFCYLFNTKKSLGTKMVSKRQETEKEFLVFIVNNFSVMV